MINQTRNLRHPDFTGMLTYSAVALWFTFALVMAAQGRYISGPHKPPLLTGLTLLIPLVSFIFAYTRHGSFWRFCQTLDLRLIVIAHAWRIVAIDFILCWIDGRLPAAFALPAGIGDILTGAAAIPLAWAISTHTPALRNRFIAWNIFGLADLVLAVTLGILHSPSTAGLLANASPTTLLMAELPRSLVPTFLVPLFILLHLLALCRRAEVEAR
jgi:hypothetical protein